MPIYLKFGPNKLSHKIQINECYLFGYAPGDKASACIFHVQHTLSLISFSLLRWHSWCVPESFTADEPGVRILRLPYPR